MSELTDKLRSAGELHKGTDLGGLLQWAALHIDCRTTKTRAKKPNITSETRQTAQEGNR